MIYGLIYLFYEPNPDDPLNREAADLYRTDKAQVCTTELIAICPNISCLVCASGKEDSVGLFTRGYSLSATRVTDGLSNTFLSSILLYDSSYLIKNIQI